jgi:hypothetical protein
MNGRIKEAWGLSEMTGEVEISDSSAREICN